MGIIEWGVIGSATYLAFQSYKDEIRNEIEGVAQSAFDLVHDAQQQYTDTLKDYAERQREESGYKRNYTVSYVWKWADGREYGPRVWSSYGKYFVAQSCSAEDRSTVPTAIRQGSSNGVAADHPNWPDQNGALNPILSQKSFDFFENGQQGPFTFNENRAARALLVSNGFSPQYWSAVMETVKGVGFFRLSEYHWIATIDMALQLATRNGHQTSAKFLCTSETNKWYDKEWRRRGRLATGEAFQLETDGIDPTIIKDYRGESITMEPIECGVDSIGEIVWSVPFTCGEERIFWPEDVDHLRDGPCRNLFRRLSTQFHDALRLDNRDVLFGPTALPRKPD